MAGEEDSSGSAAQRPAPPLPQQIRVVRCPKCDKLLPELPNYSVYVCGGCGATLQAKKNSGSDASSDTEHVKYLEVLESLPDKKGAASEASCAVLEADTNTIEARPEERFVPNRMVAAAHSQSGFSFDDKQTTCTPSCSMKLEPALRDDSREVREAKYRRIRHEDKGEAKQSARVRDRSPRPVVNSIPSNAYPVEGPFECHMKPAFIFANGEKGHLSDRNSDGPSTRVSGLEKDRTELLRMLDELRDQVQRSCEIADKSSVNASANRMVDSASSYNPHERLSRLRYGSPQLQRNGSQRSPSLNGQVPVVPPAYPSVPVQQDLHGYGESVAHMGAPSYPAAPYPWRNFDNYFHGQYDPDPLISYHHDGFYHQPACSCLHCYHREFLPVHGAPLGFNHRRAPYLMNNPSLYPVEGPVVFGAQNYNSRGMNGMMQRNHMRATLSKKPAQTCEPIVNGAPFTICYNCYEVLQLPKNSLLLGKDEYKLRCGSCSHAILVRLDGSRLDVSAPTPVSHLSPGSKNCSNNGQGSNGQNVDERLLPSYSFSVGSHCSQEKDLPSNSSEADKMQCISSSVSISEDENSPTRSNSQKNSSGSRDLPPDAEVVIRVPSLPLRDHFGYSPSERVVDGSGKGSRSTRSEHEKGVLTESFKPNKVRDVPVASVLHPLDDEYDDPEYSQDPGDGAQYVDHPRATKSGDSFFSSLIKKSFKISGGMGNGRAKVFINGYPISDRAVRKAEKIAGPIYPGEYWYDYGAGFWGVMGQPCLGMIPPYIAEFNYPMPKNCAGGNTGVFINGRELHQKDLDLLVGRGLPDSPDRSYRVEISGKVSDEVSGEELYCLGKLAPTVEKMNRGFGMRVPRIIQ
ncbi:protein ENHANCED DISEASE RESISTANCE 4-like [Miscanthus floridulus]|uniref:protein ENHANCED DISEASE RESISTANCE 4-like n=1 Tax=Miscanthus floridulus TaxID=154761 RepID=UPI00345A4B19